MRLAVVGGGPAGCLLAYHVARAGGEVCVLDASHPREKPCGGGLTAKALALLPEAPPGDPLPAIFVERCHFDSGDGEQLDLRLPRPVAIAARRELDAWLLRRAVAAGARHLPERVVALGTNELRTASGRRMPFDVVAGADGAGSLVRRTFLAPTPPERLTMAVGWFAPGRSPMAIRFAPGLAGYLWLFPRRDHVGVGLCAPLGSLATRELVARLEREVARAYPALAADPDGGRYAHTIPSPSTEPRSILEVAGPRWALVGDAAGFADPITGEGIYYALRSAEVLARALQAEGSPRHYPEAALESFGRELLKAVALRGWFYGPGVPRRVIAYSRRSAAVRGILASLVLGDEGYLGLKRRLLRAGPRFLLESALSSVRWAA